jgi:hypothetical protein
VRCFFNLLIIPLIYNFKGHFRDTYPPISLEYRPLEVMKLSLLAFEPPSTYTLIGVWCRSKTPLITFLGLLFLESCVMSGGFWQTLSLLLDYFMVFMFFLLLACTTCGEGRHYWIIFKHEARWPPKRSFICFGPLLNFPKDHRTGPKLRLSILSGWYPHRRAYEWNYLRLWPFFYLINLSWA